MEEQTNTGGGDTKTRKRNKCAPLISICTRCRNLFVLNNVFTFRYISDLHAGLCTDFLGEGD